MEKWLPIPEFPLYEVSDKGNIRSINPNQGSRINVNDGLLKPALQRVHRNYRRYRVSLRKNGKTYHRILAPLVLSAFVRPRQKGEVCRHLDGNSLNNSISNLAWGTQKDNAQDSIRHGTQVNPPVHYGESHHNAKHSDEIVAMVRAADLSQRGAKTKLAKQLGVPLITIRRWRDGVCR